MDQEFTTYRLWHPPVPHCIDDLTGWLVDFSSAKSFLERLTDILRSPECDAVLVEALSTAALVRYCRCFTSGTRKRLNIESLSGATQEEVALHTHMCGVRNWHVAHPVNMQEIYALYIIFDESPEANVLVRGFSTFSSVCLPLKAEEASGAITLCDKWIELLQSQLVEEQLRLKPFADQLTREQILGLSTEEPEPDQNISARRRQGHYK